MILDKQNEFSDGQTVTSTQASTNVIDMVAAERRIGTGEPMAVMGILDSAAASVSAETYNVSVETDSSASFGTPTTIGTTNIARNAAAGTKFFVLIPPGTKTEEFVRVNYAVTGQAPTMTVTTELVPQSFVQAEQALSAGYKVTG